MLLDKLLYVEYNSACNNFNLLVVMLKWYTCMPGCTLAADATRSDNGGRTIC
jgi:hypothetical protein